MSNSSQEHKEDYDEDEIITLKGQEEVKKTYQSMSSSEPTHMMDQNINMPQCPQSDTLAEGLDENGDPPLLKDIGISPQQIGQKILIIVRAQSPPQTLLEEPDLTGPILIGIVFGLLMMTLGKYHFGDIYTMFITGNILLYFLYNLMSKFQPIPMYSIMSTMGYGLFPMLLLGIFGHLLSLKSEKGIILTIVLSVWSSLSGSRFMEGLMKITLEERKQAIIMYPMFLFYMSFGMIAIF